MKTDTLMSAINIYYEMDRQQTDGDRPRVVTRKESNGGWRDINKEAQTIFMGNHITRITNLKKSVLQKYRSQLLFSIHL